MPFHIYNARSPSRRPRNFRDGHHFELDFADQPLAPILDPAGARQSKDIAIDVIERIRLQRDHFRAGGKSRAQRAFHIGEAYRAYLTLRLRDDMCGLEAFQNIVEDLVNALRGGKRFLHAPVDLAAIAMDVENGGGANGKLSERSGDNRTHGSGRPENRPGRAHGPFPWRWLSGRRFALP